MNNKLKIKHTNLIKSNLIAPCGMNCTLCYAYLREKSNCPGCRLFHANEPVSIARCIIKNCKEITSGKSKYCFNCEKYPCTRLKQLDKRYRTKYGVSMLENLENIKTLGIRKFIQNEKHRWVCPDCGGIICVHKTNCLFCGNPRQI